MRLHVVKPDASLHITQRPCKQTTQDTRSVSKQTTSIKHIRKTGMQFPWKRYVQEGIPNICVTKCRRVLQESWLLSDVIGDMPA